MILALLAVALVGGSLWMLWTGPVRVGTPEDVTRRAETVEREPSEVDPLVRQVVEPEASSEDRSGGSYIDEPEPFSSTVRAVDARTGVRVMRFWIRASGFGDLASDVRRWRADPLTGEVSIDLDSPPGPLSVLADRYITRDFTPDPGPRTTVRLERATSIVGVVRDADSAPVESARVDLVWYGEDGDDGDEPRESPEGVATLRRTDENGEYAFTKLPPGRWATRVTFGGVERTSAPRSARYGEWTHVDHWIDEGRRIVVDVTRPDGSPSETSRVLVSKVDVEDPILARYSDSDGRVTLGPLEPDAYRLMVVSDHGAHDPIDVVVPEVSSRTGSRTTHVRIRLQ